MARVRVCPTCGSENLLAVIRCVRCGVSLAQVSPTEAAPPASEPASVIGAENATVSCLHCEATISADQTTCPYCGELLQTGPCVVLEWPWGAQALDGELIVGRDPAASPLADRLAGTVIFRGVMSGCVPPPKACGSRIWGPPTAFLSTRTGSRRTSLFCWRKAGGCGWRGILWWWRGSSVSRFSPPPWTRRGGAKRWGGWNGPAADFPSIWGFISLIIWSTIPFMKAKPVHSLQAGIWRWSTGRRDLASHRSGTTQRASL